MAIFGYETTFLRTADDGKKTTQLPLLASSERTHTHRVGLSPVNRSLLPSPLRDGNGNLPELTTRAAKRGGRSTGSAGVTGGHEERAGGGQRRGWE